MRTLLVCLALSLILSGCSATTSSPGGAVDDSPPRESFDPGWPPIEDAPLRPGAKLFDSLQDQTVKAQRLHCTLNFIFSDENNSTLYVGTASHCVTGFRLGDELSLANGEASGTLIYCSYGSIENAAECPDLFDADHAEKSNDFALIEIASSNRQKVHPATMRIGGPTGIAPAPEPDDVAFIYGNTDYRDARSESVPDDFDARAGRVHSVTDWTAEIVFDLTSVGGDSGGPVISASGLGLGVLQYGFTVQCPGPRIDVNGVVLLAPAIDYASAATGILLEIKQWPLLDPPTPWPETPWPCDSVPRALAMPE